MLRNSLNTIAALVLAFSAAAAWAGDAEAGKCIQELMDDLKAKRQHREDQIELVSNGSMKREAYVVVAI